MSFIINLADKTDADINLVGGKAMALATMIKEKTPVPPGFVVTSDGFNEGMTKALEDEVLTAFDKLGVKQVAVRSSAMVEDSQSASWAGQLDTYLNVDRNGLVQSIKACWDSINSERARSYAIRHGANESSHVVAVIVQVMIASDVSGVAFSVNPVSKDKNEIVIEAAFGLGEVVVSGLITPDLYLVDKNSLNLRKKTIQKSQTLADHKILELAALVQRIEKMWGFAVDIEWAFEQNTLYILQSRPITTL